MHRRDWLRLAGAGLASPGTAARGANAGPVPGTLRIAVGSPETTFDPPMIGDNTSTRIVACIVEPPLTYDPLARPPRLVPQTAAALPELSPDFRTLTLKIKPGIYFADDPAFGGRPRELTAADYVFSIKRYYDPRVPSEHLYVYENVGLLGMAELRRAALAGKKPLDYDREVEGVRALDRYTLQLRFAKPSPRFAYFLAVPIMAGALAREVVERYGADIGAHPVGTGPYRLAAWRRGSRVVLERNPLYREHRYHAEPAADDDEGRAIAAALEGRRLPFVDRIEVQTIEESQPRWLAFLGGEVDIGVVPADFTRVAVPGGKLAPHLARRGVGHQVDLSPTIVFTYFNMRDPVVGGTTPEQVALRRAVALAYDGDAELRLVRDGNGIPGQSIVAPHLSGYDAAYRSEMSTHDPARARALLDIYGWRDRDGDGFRERPDGSPFVLRMASTTRQVERRLNELWRKQLAAVGLRVQFEIGTWGDLLRRSLAGDLMIWGYSWGSPTPDGSFFLGLGYGPNAGQANDARFALPAYDRIYERQAELPDGAERDALIVRAKNILVAQMPYKVRLHPLTHELTQPWVRGWRNHPFLENEWIHTRIDAPPA